MTITQNQQEVFIRLAQKDRELITNQWQTQGRKLAKWKNVARELNKHGSETKDEDWWRRTISAWKQSCKKKRKDKKELSIYEKYLLGIMEAPTHSNTDYKLIQNSKKANNSNSENLSSTFKIKKERNATLGASHTTFNFSQNSSSSYRENLPSTSGSKRKYNFKLEENSKNCNPKKMSSTSVFKAERNEEEAKKFEHYKISEELKAISGSLNKISAAFEKFIDVYYSRKAGVH